MIHTMKELCKRYHVNDIKTHVFTKEEYDYINSHIIRYLYTSSNCRYGVIKYQKNNGKLESLSTYLLPSGSIPACELFNLQFKMEKDENSNPIYYIDYNPDEKIYIISLYEENLKLTNDIPSLSEYFIIDREYRQRDDKIYYKKKRDNNFIYDMTFLSKEKLEGIEFLKKNRILRDLMRACIIGKCDFKYRNNYMKNHMRFVTALSKCDMFIFRNSITKNICRLTDDIKSVLEEFIKLIPEVCDLNSSVDKDESIHLRKMCMFNNYKEFIKEYYKIFYGSPNVLGNELICNLLSILKL